MAPKHPMERLKKSPLFSLEKRGLKWLRRPVPLLSATLTLRDVGLALREMWLPSVTRQKKEMARLTQRVKEFLGVTHVGFYMGGRASLCAVMRTLELGPGDEVLIPAFTCQCVVNGLRYEGVNPVYVDIELESYGMDASKVEAAVTDRTRALLIQHTFGLPGRDLQALLDFARKKGLYIIEDCAHATGGRWRGKPLGTLGDIGFFSSERSKIINTIHGGFVVTNSNVLGPRLEEDQRRALEAPYDFVDRLFRTLIHSYLTLTSPLAPVTAPLAQWLLGRHLLPQMHEAEYSGAPCPQYHWRMPDSMASLMLNQVSAVESQLSRRRDAAEKWRGWALKHGFRPPVVSSDSEPTWLRFPLCMAPEVKADPQELGGLLGVTVGVWFQSAAHPLPLELAHCPNGMKASKCCINLPTLLPQSFAGWRRSMERGKFEQPL